MFGLIQCFTILFHQTFLTRYFLQPGLILTQSYTLTLENFPLVLPPSAGYCQSHFGGLCQFLITGSFYSTNSSTLEILGPEYLQIHAPTCCFKETNTIQSEHYLHPIFGRLHFFKKLENLFGLKISKKNVWAGVIRYSFAPLKL